MSEVEIDDGLSAPKTGEMDINEAVQIVLKTAVVHDGIVRGIHETTKALDRRQAVLCILADNCDEPIYKNIIIALCAEHKIPLLKVDNNKKLGEWAGLCKIDSTGKPRKVVRCSVVCIKDFGEESPALDVVLEYLKNGK